MVSSVKIKSKLIKRLDSTKIEIGHFFVSENYCSFSGTDMKNLSCVLGIILYNFFTNGCRTLTFIFTGNAGLASELNNFLTVADYAEKTNRKLLVDNGEWNYGNFLQIFDFPKQNCEIPEDDWQVSILKARKEKRYQHLKVRRDWPVEDASFLFREYII